MLTMDKNALNHIIRADLFGVRLLQMYEASYLLINIFC